MKIAIMQPTFNPWIGYFELIDYVDKFIFLDNVQLARRSWQTRNKFKINNLEYMFSIPLKKEYHRNDTLLNQVNISFEHIDFRKKLINLLEINYKKARFYSQIINSLKDIINYNTDSLSSYNINFIKSISDILGYKTEFLLSSNINIKDVKKGELIYTLSCATNANIYVSPIGSYDYLEDYRNKFVISGISIEYQHYNHPIYTQIGTEFIPYLGVIDLLLNCGIEESQRIILSGRRYMK